MAARVIRPFGFDVCASGLGKRQRPGNPRGKNAGVEPLGKLVEYRAMGDGLDELHTREHSIVVRFANQEWAHRSESHESGEDASPTRARG